MPALTDAVEGSTYIVRLEVYREDGAAVVPNEAVWSLRDNYNQVVNNRDEVPLVPATTMTVILSGDDLVYERNSKSIRAMTVTGTYDGLYGTDLPIAEEFTFSIRPLAGVEDE